MFFLMLNTLSTITLNCSTLKKNLEFGALPDNCAATVFFFSDGCREKKGDHSGLYNPFSFFGW